MKFQDVEVYVPYVAGKFRLHNYQIYEIITSYSSMLSPKTISDNLRIKQEIVEGVIDLMVTLKALEKDKQSATEFLMDKQLYDKVSELEVSGSWEEVEEVVNSAYNTSTNVIENRELIAYDLIGFKGVLSYMFSNNIEYLNTLQQVMSVPKGITDFKERYSTYGKVPDHIYIPWNRGFTHEEFHLILDFYLSILIKDMVASGQGLFELIKIRVGDYNSYVCKLTMGDLDKVFTEGESGFYYIEELDWRNYILHLMIEEDLNINNLHHDLTQLIRDAIINIYQYPFVTEYIEKYILQLEKEFRVAYIQNFKDSINHLINKRVQGSVISLTLCKEGEGIRYLVYNEGSKEQGRIGREKDLSKHLLTLYWGYRFQAVTLQESTVTDEVKEQLNMFQDKLTTYGERSVIYFIERNFSLAEEYTDDSHLLLTLCELFRNNNPINALLKINPHSLLTPYGNLLGNIVNEVFLTEIKSIVRQTGMDVNTSTDYALSFTGVPPSMMKDIKAKRPYRRKESIPVPKGMSRYLTTRRGGVGDRYCVEVGEEKQALEDIYYKFIKGGLKCMQ